MLSSAHLKLPVLFSFSFQPGVHEDPQIHAQREVPTGQETQSLDSL